MPTPQRNTFTTNRKGFLSLTPCHTTTDGRSPNDPLEIYSGPVTKTQVHTPGVQ